MRATSAVPSVPLAVPRYPIASGAEVEDDGDNVWTHRDRVVNEYDLARARFGNATFSAGGVRSTISCTAPSVYFDPPPPSH